MSKIQITISTSTLPASSIINNVQTEVSLVLQKLHISLALILKRPVECFLQKCEFLLKSGDRLYLILLKVLGCHRGKLHFFHLNLNTLKLLLSESAIVTELNCRDASSGAAAVFAVHGLQGILKLILERMKIISSHFKVQQCLTLMNSQALKVIQHSVTAVSPLCSCCVHWSQTWSMERPVNCLVNCGGWGQRLHTWNQGLELLCVKWNVKRNQISKAHEWNAFKGNVGFQVSQDWPAVRKHFNFILMSARLACKGCSELDNAAWWWTRKLWEDSQADYKVKEKRNAAWHTHKVTQIVGENSELFPQCLLKMLKG